MKEEDENRQDKNIKRKKQSNPHAINTCIDILFNILAIDHSHKRMTS